MTVICYSCASLVPVASPASRASRLAWQQYGIHDSPTVQSDQAAPQKNDLANCTSALQSTAAARGGGHRCSSCFDLFLLLSIVFGTCCLVALFHLAHRVVLFLHPLAPSILNQTLRGGGTSYGEAVVWDVGQFSSMGR